VRGTTELDRDANDRGSVRRRRGRRARGGTAEGYGARARRGRGRRGSGEARPRVAGARARARRDMSTTSGYNELRRPVLRGRERGEVRERGGLAAFYRGEEEGERARGEGCGGSITPLMAEVTEGESEWGRGSDGSSISGKMSVERKSRRFPARGGEGSGASEATRPVVLLGREARVWLILSLYPKIQINIFLITSKIHDNYTKNITIKVFIFGPSSHID
jgi:hypothetical protein